MQHSLKNIKHMLMFVFVLLAAVKGQSLILDQSSISFDDLTGLTPQTIKFKLSSKPAGSVVVRLSPTSDPFFIDQCIFQFTTSDWNVEKSATVSVKMVSEAAGATRSSTISILIDRQTLTSNTCDHSTQNVPLTYTARPSGSGNFWGFGSLTSLDGEVVTFVPTAAGTLYLIKSDSLDLQVDMEICDIATNSFCVTNVYLRYYRSVYSRKLNYVTGVLTESITNFPFNPSIVDTDSTDRFYATLQSAINIDIKKVQDATTGAYYSLVIFGVPGSYRNRVSGLAGNFDGVSLTNAQYLAQLTANIPNVPDSDKISLCGACSHTSYPIPFVCIALPGIPTGACDQIVVTTTATIIPTTVPVPPIPTIILPPDTVASIPSPTFVLPDPPAAIPDIHGPSTVAQTSSSLSATDTVTATITDSPSPIPSSAVTVPTTSVQLGIPPLPLKIGSDPWNIKSVQNTVAKITKVGNDQLQLTYPALCGAPKNKQCGPQSGMSFFAAPVGVFPAESVTFEYDVYFPREFDFKSTGILPGLSIGTGKVSSSTWRSRNSGAARLMWQLGKDGKTPELKMALDIPKEVITNSNQPIQKPLKPKLNDWNIISVTVTLNTHGKKDGSLSYTLNGSKMVQNNLIWRKSKLGLNGLAMTSWYGMNGGEGNPSAETAQFRRFRVAKHK